MPGPLLYSVNPFVKQVIQQVYQNDLHYAWCSDSYDATKLDVLTVGSLVPPSSNPADIYRNLKADVGRGDMHSPWIRQHVATQSALAERWFSDGSITEFQRDEILYLVQNAPLDHWRPILYLIPRGPLGARCKLVPVATRAGVGNEYIVEDLKRDEFDMIEI